MIKIKWFSITIILLTVCLVGAGAFWFFVRDVENVEHSVFNISQEEEPIEILEKRTENNKTFDLGDGKKKLVAHMGAIHYKDDYANATEQWKDIDLTWEDDPSTGLRASKIVKAPFELTLDGKQITIKDKKTGNISTIELLDIGGKEIQTPDWLLTEGLASFKDIAKDTDLEIVVEQTRVRFARILKSDQAPQEVRFRVEGDTSLLAFLAQDQEAEIPVRATLENGILTETFEKPDRPIKYAVRIDPTWQVGASTDDCWTTANVGDNHFSYLQSYAPVGNGGATWLQGSGFRFLNITIPAGSTITSAQLILTAYNAGSSTVKTRLRAQANVNPATFSDAVDFHARTWTTAYVNWDAIPAWTKDVEYTSPDFTAVIQEVIDLSGWASGNPMAIVWDDFQGRSNLAQYRYAWAYDGSTTYAPQLVITYTEPVAATVTTQDASSLGETTATLNGNITATGGVNAGGRGFEYGIASEVYTSTTTDYGSHSTGAFTYGLTGFNSKYHLLLQGICHQYCWHRLWQRGKLSYNSDSFSWWRR